MKSKMTIGLVITAILTTLLWAGDLNPSAPPTSGTMKPLNDIEPRIALHQLDIPLTISTSGSYYLAENVTYSGSSNCIYINADNVTLDLCGFTMSGTDVTSSCGIHISGRNDVEIRNGTIRDFGSGIYEITATGENQRILGVRVLSCPNQGIYLLGCDNCQVKDCTVADGGTTGTASSVYGIFVSESSIVSGNTVYKNGISSSCRVFGIYTYGGCTITNNVVYGNGTSSTSDFAIGIYTGNSCTVTGNTAYDNGDLSSGVAGGIRTNSGCTITNNAVYSNGTSSTAGYIYGIDASAGSVTANNSVYDNGDSAGGVVYGIFTASGCTITCNAVYNNGTSSTGSNVYGILANTGCSVTGNTSRSNGNLASGTVYGIYLAGYDLVNDNLAYGNSGSSGGTNMNMAATGCVYGTNCAP